MAKKIFLSPSNQDKNTYSYGNTTEDVQCGKIAKACEAALKRCGFEVKLEQYDTMQNRVAHSNAWGADLHVPIHTNAFNEKVGGTRIFYYKEGSEGHLASQKVFDALKALTPGMSDACQRNANLYEVNRPNAPSVYVEAEFHDVPEYAKWIIDNTTVIGEAICKGICEYFGVKYKTAEEEKYYRVQTGAFRNIDYAVAHLDKVHEAGYKDAYMVLVGGLYKIQVGAYKYKMNAVNLANKLEADGFKTYITTQGGTAVQVTSKKTIDEIAVEVVQGKWGNGSDRTKRLTKAGYSEGEIAAIQKKVNELL